MPHGGHLQAAHLFFDGGSLYHGFDRLFRALLIRRAEEIFKAAVVKRAQRVRRAVSAGQRIETQPSPVDHGLAQRPEQHGAVKAAQHLGHIGGVGKGQILEHDQIRAERVEIRAQIVEIQQHLIRHRKALVNAFEQRHGGVKLRLRALQMEGRHADRDINRRKGFHGKALHTLFYCVNYHSPPRPRCQQKSEKDFRIFPRFSLDKGMVRDYNPIS